MTVSRTAALPHSSSVSCSAPWGRERYGHDSSGAAHRSLVTGVPLVQVGSRSTW